GPCKGAYPIRLYHHILKYADTTVLLHKWIHILFLGYPSDLHRIQVFYNDNLWKALSYLLWLLGSVEALSAFLCRKCRIPHSYFFPHLFSPIQNPLQNQSWNHHNGFLLKEQ